jgi:integrase
LQIGNLLGRPFPWRTHLLSRGVGVAAFIVDSEKYATAHDLRRPFGERWAQRVMPQVSMELMRHESIDTTLKYYVGRNAQRTAKAVREAYEEARRRQDETGRNAGGEQRRDTLRDTPDPEGDNSENPES